MNRLSKILIIFGVVAIVIAVAYAGWVYLFRANNGPVEQIPGNQAIQDLGPRPKAISSDAVFDYWINKIGEIYFVTANGAIKKASLEGSVEDLASQANGELAKIIPSFDGSWAIFQFGNAQNPTFAVYDTVTKGWFGLPTGTETAAWDPISNNRIAYLRTANNSTRLYFFDVKKKSSQELAAINLKDVSVSWPTANFLHLTELPAVEHPGNDWAFNIKNKTFSVFNRDKGALSINWSKDGKTGVRLADGGLSLINETGAVLADLSLKTLPSKCAFTNLRLYCLASINQNNLSANFVDDYLKQKQHDSEDIYLISLLGLKTGGQPIVLKTFDSLSAGVAVIADHPQIHASSLYFISRFDNKLYSISL